MRGMIIGGMIGCEFDGAKGSLRVEPETRTFTGEGEFGVGIGCVRMRMLH